MRQFVLIKGARVQETFRFSNSCNALAGQIDHILPTLKGRQSERLYLVTNAKASLSGKRRPYYSPLNANHALFIDPEPRLKRRGLLLFIEN